MAGALPADWVPKEGLKRGLASAAERVASTEGDDDNWMRGDLSTTALQQYSGWRAR